MVSMTAEFIPSARGTGHAQRVAGADARVRRTAGGIPVGCKKLERGARAVGTEVVVDVAVQAPTRQRRPIHVVVHLDGKLQGLLVVERDDVRLEYEIMVIDVFSGLRRRKLLGDFR